MKQIYDIITKKNIVLEDRKLTKQSRELGFDYSCLQRLFWGEIPHILSRYILPDNKHKLITIVNFETKEEYDCVTSRSLFYYFGKKLGPFDGRFFYALRMGKQTLATICGKIVYLKGRPKINRLKKMAAAGPEYKQKLLEQCLRRKIAGRIRTRIGQALKSGKKNKTHDLLGCSIDFLMGYLESKFEKEMNWKNYGQWHIDHIKPLSSFNLQDSEQQKIACHYSNLQPLWAKDNLKKGDRLPINSSIPSNPNSIS